MQTIPTVVNAPSSLLAGGVHTGWLGLTASALCSVRKWGIPDHDRVFDVMPHNGRIRMDKPLHIYKVLHSLFVFIRPKAERDGSNNAMRSREGRLIYNDLFGAINNPSFG
jgi:hypothetical protein